MQKMFRTQRLTAAFYIVMAVVVFAFTLCFMTEYKDLFGLKLKQNSQISFFHDSILQMFNKQIFMFALFGILIILFSFLLEIFSKVPDKFALMVLELSLIICCGCSVYALTNFRAVEVFYLGLDFQYLKLEGMVDYAPHVTTFRIGTAVYITNILCCVFYGAAIAVSHIKFLKLRKRGA